jgi:amidase
MPDPALWSATRQAAAIRAGDLSSEELLDLVLDRIDRLNPEVNAVVTIDPDGAREAAQAADAALARGEPLGPLHGLPITVKDALATAGMRSTGGAVELGDHVPTQDATAVARARAAGAVVLGKTNLPRWSGDLQSYNELFGTTNNPWALDRVPGGSSGGAAAAVACGFTSFELGTDIGGSIRLPAAWCGVFGHKPSYGIVPSYGYLDHVGGGLTQPDVNVVGPLARAAEDLELLLDVLAGPGPADAVAWRLELPPPRHARLADYRVAAWLDDPAAPVDASVAAVLEQVAAAVAGTGAQVDRTARPELDFATAAALGRGLISVATTPAVADGSFARLCAMADQVQAGEVTPAHLEALHAFTQRHRTWLRHDAARAQARLAWAEFFTRYDVLLCPVTLVPPIAHQQEGSFAERAVVVNGQPRPYPGLIDWTSLIGSAYLPVTVPPVGRTPEGLPVGVQVVAPFLEDRSALLVAREIAELGDGYVPPPLALAPE